MDPIWQAVIEGVIQGATEFVPISSSAHLIVLPELLGWKQPSVAFDVLVHLATLIAVFVYFAEDWRRMIGGALSGLRGRTAERPDDLRLAALLLVGTIPGVIGGLLLNDVLDNLIENHARVAAREASIELMATGLILLAADKWALRAFKSLSSLGIRDALVIGLAQAIAILPGISRSGSTIAAGQFLGLSRTEAARFSFLLSAPIILGANVVKLGDLLRQPPDTAAGASLVAGFAAALIVGYLALGWLMRFLAKAPLSAFAAYCLIAGAVALVLLR